MKVDFNPTIPIYIQIMGEIKKEIVSGIREAGSKVETVRDLAQEMGVNPNTMQRAFAELEREGLLYTERTAGRFITGDTVLIKKVKEESVCGYIQEFMNHMKNSGFGRQDIIRMIDEYAEVKIDG
jgi:GntR family transcriptional regulator